MTAAFLPQLFLDAAHQASILPFGSDLIFYAMKSFGTYPMGVPVVLSIIGGILGYIFNWYVGRTLMFYEHKGRFRLGPVRYERARSLFDQYLFVLLVFS